MTVVLAPAEADLDACPVPDTKDTAENVGRPCVAAYAAAAAGNGLKVLDGTLPPVATAAACPPLALLVLALVLAWEVAAVS